MSDIDNILSYDYHLPSNLIAFQPVLPKENARLLVYFKNTDEVKHLKFSDLTQIIPDDTAIIFNDTRVIKARILGHKQSGGAVEIMLNQPLNDDKFSCYIRGRVNERSILNFGNGISAQVISLNDDGTRVVKFSKFNEPIDNAHLFKELELIGHVPLPPYIKRADTKNDESWYQSIFAKKDGAVAAPTASLHFSDEMLQAIKAKHETAYLTLHVGAGTFKSVECENINNHVMHSEFYDIPTATQELINSNKKILGVGTTVTRCVEEFARTHKSSGFCKLFLNLNNPPIRQNYLLTNFHLPKSTLIMLVTSFIGLEKTMQIYKIAIEKGYRFYSYGDGMLVL
ncbi:tRNA preQ1(34) S-adenosylmethionine ribosyltransferase-isomerase QueA [Campylobacter sp. faydin G-24]|uniref:S-adenosylmethionine:tRNA ribosyltransferase-isomerase n=1 Tax=Campylobacter anatolicus TaxID=2829105 RepID=A0ABS5HJH3_9BACT|nr:tRNA preQ1(34) S-adenosylmethionine ribosyltransferase-isomerase QueA [Campylobacter anatolicus]MBR8462006.1 tRNA preQ1(34) S-adenosylmethionine ribosyltransferase-isomerase QueA [Campylobacter anatolicus]MBR8464403.1 tRNA preQ1(34) S-adenosylmethionine ribosyltransferase-isomerase QueA [Campylobacter anatolicus]